MDFQLDLSLSVLVRTPDILRDTLTSLPVEWLAGNDGPGTWSPLEILCHLINGEKSDWIPRARIILDSGTSRAFEAFDRSVQLPEGEAGSVDNLLKEFADLRKENIEGLRGMGIGASQLKARGVHPEFGQVSMAQLLATWVVHDLSHIAQIAEVMSRQYRQAVGPWRAYLPILGGPVHPPGSS